MNARLALVAGALLAITGCSSPGQPAVTPGSVTNVARLPSSITYGRGTLLLAVDRERLVAGSVARVLAFSATSASPIFHFFVEVPNAPADVIVGGITSDASGRVYVSFSGCRYNGASPICVPPYDRGAIAVYNRIPPCGCAARPDRLIESTGLSVVPTDGFTRTVNGLAVDSAGTIYGAGLGSSLGVFPADANGPTAPFKSLTCIEGPYSVALDRANDYYVTCSDIVAKFSPFPNSKLLGDFASLFCGPIGSGCYDTPLLSIPSSGVIYTAGVQVGAGVLPSFVASYAPSSANGFHAGSPARLIMGPHTQLGFLRSLAACPDGRIYVSQSPDERYPNTPAGILEFLPSSNGDTAPARILLKGDATVSAIGF